MKEKDLSIYKKRETILRGSPLLSIFLSDKFADRNAWVDLMTEPFKQIHLKITDFYGDSFNDMLKPLKVTGEAFRLFDSSYPDNARSLMMNAVVIMGFEIGDKNITSVFAGDIVNRLVEIKCFDKLAVADKQSKLISSTFITSVLNSGIEWQKEIISNNPDEFSKFISTIT